MTHRTEDQTWLAHRMVAIGAQRYGGDPAGRRAAALVMARNALRLALAEAPEAEVGEAVLQVLEQHKAGRAG